MIIAYRCGPTLFVPVDWSSWIRRYGPAAAGLPPRGWDAWDMTCGSVDDRGPLADIDPDGRLTVVEVTELPPEVAAARAAWLDFERRAEARGAPS